MAVPRGPRRSDLAVAVACVLAVVLFGTSRQAPPPAAPAPAPVAPPRVLAAAAAVPADADGVQRRVAAPAIALTFDDGPDPRWTPTVLALLRQHGVKATFCLVGVHVVAHPELVRRIAADGHTLCDHSWDHDEALRSKPAAAIRADLLRTYDAIERASGGVAPVYFRAPGGNWSPRVVAVARELDLRPLGWTVDPRDWQRPQPAAIARSVLTATRGGGDVVLLHDGYGDRSRTVAALRTILTALAGSELVRP